MVNTDQELTIGSSPDGKGLAVGPAVKVGEARLLVVGTSPMTPADVSQPSANSTERSSLRAVARSKDALRRVGGHPTKQRGAFEHLESASGNTPAGVIRPSMDLGEMSGD